MSKLEEYANKYKHVKMERRDGILQVTLHTDGKELIWSLSPHEELGDYFSDIANDSDNKVVILTGTGNIFIDEMAEAITTTIPPSYFDKIYFDAKK